MRASLCATALLLVATALCVSARDATDRTRNASHQSSGYELKARNLRWSTADDVVVDAVFGNDTLCRTNVSFPCQTISTAIVLVEFTAHMNSSTIGVRNGRYPVCDVKVTAARLMLRSSCSSGSAEDCAVTLDCTGCDYCFQLQTEASVIEFANLAMVGSRVFAIPYLSSDLSFTNVTFSNHTGGILEHTISASTFPTLNLTGCRISDNNLTQPVISHQAGRVELESTVFVRNQLHSSMNASTALIACVEGIVEAAFCEFSDNVAINASVLQFWDLARVFVISSMFQRNVGLTTVAVIQSGIATTLEVSFDDCTFSDNAATGPLEHGYGGAIGTLLVDSVWSITSTTFTNNSAAASSGGALFFRAPYATQAVLSISNSKFVLNNAHADGGAICVRSQSDDGNYTLASQSGSKYRTVGRQAGSVDVIIDQCTFSGNAVESGRGGAVAVATTSGSGTRIQHSICSGNRAQLEGGCLMVQGSGLSDFTVENSTFTNNNAFTDGGAVAVRGEFTEPSILTSHFERNGAVSGGGAVLIDAVGAVISNCSFEFNNAAILGGAVKFQASVTTAHSTVRFTEFRNNSAYKGGAVAVQSTFVHLTWIQCIGNTAVINGGCIFIANAALTYGEDCQFAGNIATGSSAGPSGSRSEIVGLRGAGGAIYIYNSFFRLVRANLRNNSAPTDAGGAICATTSGLQMSAVTLQNNSALFGGAVATVLQSDTGLGRCTFLNNSATEGGAIYSAQTSTTSVASCDFRFNTASESGGAVTVTDPFSFGSASFHSCGFSDNLALGVAEGGGALCIRYMTVGVEEGNFTNNSAPNSGGGAIYWTEAEPVYTEPIVWMNNSARYGDDVSSSACSTAVMHPDAYANTSFANGPLFSIQPPISLELLDCLGQRVLLDTQTTQFASVGPLDFVQGITTSDYVDGVLTFNTLYLRTLEETVVLQFETPLNGKGLYTSLQLTVKPCPAGYFLSSDLACTPCAAGSFSQSTPNISQTVCELCSAGSFSGSAGQSTCAVCPVGRFASEVGSASCQSCGSVDGYTLGNGSRLCQSCVNANGLECRNGKAAIARGFWGYPIANETRLGTVRCPAGYCNGGPPVHGECASHRVPESPLCGQCESGYVSYLSSPECVRCDETNVGMVALLLLLMWLFVLLVMLLSSGRSKQTAELKVLLFFTSTARIILGDASRWTQWLRLLENGDVGATGFGLCVFALSPYSLEVLQMVFPSLALAELAVTAGVLWIACHFEWISWEWFNGNRFLRTAMALLTFSFSSAMVDILQYLQCIPAGSTEVLLSAPAVDCHSADYKDRLWFVYFLMAVWLLVLPLALAVFLYRLYQNELLTKPAVMDRWGFLYSTFRPSLFWFEVFLLFRRFLIVAVAVLMGNQPEVRTAALVTVILGLQLLHIGLRPFSSRAANRWETASLSILLLVAVLTNGFSVEQDAEYPIPVQVLTSLLIGLFGLALLCALLLGRAAHYEWVQRVNLWLEAQTTAVQAWIRSLAPTVNPTAVDRMALRSVAAKSISEEEWKQAFAPLHQPQRATASADSGQLAVIMEEMPDDNDGDREYDTGHTIPDSSDSEFSSLHTNTGDGDMSYRRLN